MRSGMTVAAICGAVACGVLMAPAHVRGQAPAAPAQAAAPDPVKTIVGRLDLERYKATIKGLTAFGDRRQGTDRNRAAVDWIEAQLKSYGCSNTERIKYEYQPPAPAARARAAAAPPDAAKPPRAAAGRAASARALA